MLRGDKHDSIIVTENNIDEEITVAYKPSLQPALNVRKFMLSEQKELVNTTMDGKTQLIAPSRNFGWDDIRSEFLARTKIFINHKYQGKSNSVERLKLIGIIDEANQATTVHDLENNIRSFVNSKWFKEIATPDGKYWLLIADNMLPTSDVTTTELAKQARHAVYFKFAPEWHLPYDGPIETITKDPFAGLPYHLLENIFARPGMSNAGGIGIPRVDQIVAEDCYNDKRILRFVQFDSRLSLFFKYDTQEKCVVGNIVTTYQALCDDLNRKWMGMKECIDTEGISAFVNRCDQLYTVSENTYGQNKLLQHAITTYVHHQALLGHTYPQFENANTDVDSIEKIEILGAILRSLYIVRGKIKDAISKLKDFEWRTRQNGKTNIIIQLEMNKLVNNDKLDAERAQIVLAMGTEDHKEVATLRLINNEQFNNKDFLVILTGLSQNHPKYLQLLDLAKLKMLSQSANYMHVKK
ncbi:hypothetical protein CYMTET_41265 [Cymbomonas tetramitiformis]|uniref:Uncharacterized protein n=1 Tax=Cymbomonas tetramitiformis TaxID=36881 RepID=A0AAE0C894_9CHLO|nr:hypothetical protein CYMTET_41265 [Cymbomonas tetramitiformis]